MGTLTTGSERRPKFLAHIPAQLTKYSHSIVPRLVSTPLTFTFWLEEGPSLLDECEITLWTAQSPTNLAPPE